MATRFDVDQLTLSDGTKFDYAERDCYVRIRTKGGENIVVNPQDMEPLVVFLQDALRQIEVVFDEHEARQKASQVQNQVP